MKSSTSAIIMLLSLTVAVGGIAFGVKASHQKNALQKEAQALREQLRERESAASRNPEDKKRQTALQEPAAGNETNRISSLQEQLAAKDAELESARAELARTQDQQRHESFQERMARMKAEDPERYADMIRSRTEHKEKMRYSQATRLATLMDVDTGSMNSDELANHDRLLEKLTGLWNLTDQFDPSAPPDRETMNQLFSAVREIGDMMQLERNVMLRQLGNEVGLSGSEAEDFASYAESIFSATTMRPPRGGRGRQGSD